MSAFNFPSLNFDLGETADALRETVQRFAAAEIAPPAARRGGWNFRAGGKDRASRCKNTGCCRLVPVGYAGLAESLAPRRCRRA